ncbi:MAG: hypothetical protein KAH20_12500 [Methylococcales bacterium]|nr:hypothetical protein [Methylococcales bacterium]
MQSTFIIGLKCEKLHKIIYIGEVCFWAEVNFTSGNTATSPESCVTAAANSTVNINLDILGGTLSLVANPQLNVNAYINVAPVQTKIQPITSESSVVYVLESGALPAGVTLQLLTLLPL